MTLSINSLQSLALSFVGATAATMGGALGGHLAFGTSVGADDPPPQA